jgi:hypothetical protein
VNQKKFFLFFAGTTRAIVALLAGVGLLLAMRSKVFAGITYKGDPPQVAEGLMAAEMFFCFLAGFSETFVPNILSKATETKDKEKTAAEKAAAEKAAAVKVAAEKAAREKAAAAAKTEAAAKAAAEKAEREKAAAGHGTGA